MQAKYGIDPSSNFLRSNSISGILGNSNIVPAR